MPNAEKLQGTVESAQLRPVARSVLCFAVEFERECLQHVFHDPKLLGTHRGQCTLNRRFYRPGAPRIDLPTDGAERQRRTTAVARILPPMQ